MTEPILVAIASGVVGFMLLAASAHHCRHRAALAKLLHKQRFLPVWSQPPVTALLGPVEGAIGAWISLAVVGGDPRDVRTAAGASLALALVFGMYVVALRRVDPGADCGCYQGSTHESESWASLLRPLALVGLSAFLLLGPAVLPGSLASRAACLVVGALLGECLVLAPRAWVAQRSLEGG